MIQLIKNNFSFFGVYLIVFLISIVSIVYTEQLYLHQQINTCVGNPLIDFVFKYITHLGDGLFIIALSVLISFYNSKKAFLLLLAYALCGGFTQFLKEVFFNFEMRPYFYYSFHHFQLKIVEGVEMHSQNSFPSGHATAAFCLFTFLSFNIENKTAKFLIAVLAIVVSFSRVYLSQHFTEDITAGSLIGIIFTTSIYYLFTSTSYSKKLKVLEQPIYSLFKRDNAK